MLLKAFNELLKDDSLQKETFPSVSNNDVVKTLDAHGLSSYLTGYGLKENQAGEILDPWGRPYLFYKKNDRVVAVMLRPTPADE